MALQQAGLWYVKKNERLSQNLICPFCSFSFSVDSGPMMTFFVMWDSESLIPLEMVARLELVWFLGAFKPSNHESILIADKYDASNGCVACNNRTVEMVFNVQNQRVLLLSQQDKVKATPDSKRDDDEECWECEKKTHLKPCATCKIIMCVGCLCGGLCVRCLSKSVDSDQPLNNSVIVDESVAIKPNSSLLHNFEVSWNQSFPFSDF
jgi:hypothetical protein